VTVDEDTTLNGNVLLDNGNGVDSDPDGDTLTITGNTDPTNGGTVTVNTDGTFSFDPNGDFEDLQVGESRDTSFTYTIDDGNGGTDTATVTVTVTGVNDAPVAQDDAVTTDEDTALNGNVLADNGNGADSDVENDTLTVTEVNGSAANVGTQITLTTGALLTLNADGTFAYDPNGQFESLNDGESATDSFTYTIDDGNGGSDTATVTLEIIGVTDAAPTIITIGNAPEHISRKTRGAWEDAWTDDAITITHRADYLDESEPYSDVLFTNSGSGELLGGDIYRGDLGVSGQSIPSSHVRQELDGSEALRFELDGDATSITFGVNRLFTNDDNRGFFEAGRVQFFNAAGELVGEEVFVANSDAGDLQVTVTTDEAFSVVVFTAGVYNGDDFVFGGYATESGEFGSDPIPRSNGQSTGNSPVAVQGSDYLLDYLEFTMRNTAAQSTLAGNINNKSQEFSDTFDRDPGMDVMAREWDENMERQWDENYDQYEL
jgi:VCBS repeat-containing protein